ncbi:DMT family transporter [Spirillospora sp. NPDC049024]
MRTPSGTGARPSRGTSAAARPAATTRSACPGGARRRAGVDVLAGVLLGADVAGTLLLLQPVLAVALGAVVLGERPGAAQIAGCALVVAAVRLAGRGSVAPRDDSGMGSRARGHGRTGGRPDRAEVP